MIDPEKPRLSRLTAILTQLRSRRILTAREIADRHQVSIRTVYRDIRALERSGIPIMTIEGKGYSLMPGFNLPPVMFTEAEAHALVTAEQWVQQIHDTSFSTHYKQAMTKIKAVLAYEQQEMLELLASRIQIRQQAEDPSSSGHLIALQHAITQFQLLRMEYQSVKHQLTERVIEPFALYSTKGNWILIAFCRMRQDFRAFRLDRIQALTPTGKTFEPHDMSLQDYFEQCRKQFSDTPDTPLS